MPSKGRINDELVMTVFEAFVVAAAVLVLVQVVTTKVSDNSFYLQYYAKDNAFILDTMQAADGDMRLWYSADLEVRDELNLAVTENEVTLQSRNETNASFSYEYATSDETVRETVIPAFSHIQYHKNDSEIWVEEFNGTG